MLQLISIIESKPILSLQTGSKIAVIDKPIIDPSKLIVIGFYITSPSDTGNILLCMDIREINRQGIVIDRHDTLVYKQDLVKFKDIIDINYELIGKKVITESGSKLGKVSDFVVDDKSFFIKKIYSRQSVVKNFSGTGVIIDRSQIIEVTDSKLVVKDATVSEKQSQKRGLATALLGEQAT